LIIPLVLSMVALTDLRKGFPQDDGGLLTRIHIHNHEINQG
jgi:hypothetical protein